MTNGMNAIAVLKKPSIKGATSFLTSDTVLIVAGALLVTPILFGILSSLIIGKVPVLANNIMLALLVTSLILFILAGVFKGKLRALLVGAATGALVNAIQQTQFAQSVLARIGGAAG